MRVVDMRSDTVTKPGKAMRAAMAAAEVGDDVRGDDPTVKALEEKVAKLMGKEAGLYLPSATMSNLLAVLTHCQKRGSEILLGDRCHIFLDEQGGISQFGGVHPRTVRNRDDGTFCLEELKSKVRDFDPEGHFPTTALVCVENTNCDCGGKAMPREWLEQLFEVCRSLNLPLHCDGARIFNAAEAMGVDPKELVKGCSSVTTCMSKGLGAPVGAVLVGDAKFIFRARLLRKALGGGMRQSGVLAAAAIYALDNQRDRLKEDHHKARKLAKAFSDHGDGVFVPDVSLTTTNLLYVFVTDLKRSNPDQLVDMLKDTTSDETGVSLLCIKFTPTSVRFAIHVDIDDDALEAAKDKIKVVMNKILNK